MTRFHTFWLIALSALFVGCGERDTTEPPTLRVGVDECDRCRMIISDHRYAAACIVKDSSTGRHAPRAFDDIGCMLLYETSEGDITHHYVADYNVGQWVNVNDAVFLKSEELTTPMASGIVACTTSASAQKLREQYPGDVMNYRQLSTRQINP